MLSDRLSRFSQTKARATPPRARSTRSSLVSLRFAVHPPSAGTRPAQRSRFGVARASVCLGSVVDRLVARVESYAGLSALRWPSGRWLRSTMSERPQVPALAGGVVKPSERSRAGVASGRARRHRTLGQLQHT